MLRHRSLNFPLNILPPWILLYAHQIELLDELDVLQLEAFLGVLNSCLYGLPLLLPEFKEVI